MFKQPPIMLTYEESAVRLAEDIVINVAFCLLVLIPIILLSYLKNKVIKLMLVLAFVLLSAIVSSFLANTTHKTSLAVIAGYVLNCSKRELIGAKY